MNTVVSGLDLVALDEAGRQFEAVWSLTDNANGLFTISSTSGAISLVAATLNYETTTSYAVVAQAESSSITGEVMLTIAVIDLLETLTVTDGNVAANTLLTSASQSTAVEGLELSVASESASLENASVTWDCLLYTSPSPRDRTRSRMPSSA